MTTNNIYLYHANLSSTTNQFRTRLLCGGSDLRPGTIGNYGKNQIFTIEIGDENVIKLVISNAF